MGLFDSPKKEAAPERNENKTLLAMPLFKHGNGYNIHKVIEKLETTWGVCITDFSGDDEAAVFSLEGETVALALMPFPVPSGDIEGTAQYAYNWLKASEELEDHTGHAIVTLMTSWKTPLERFKILSKVLHSILTTTDAVGVYQGSQSLLISRDQYLNDIEELKEGGIPTMLWIYIGLRKYATGNCGYTYGLKDFQKLEMEVIDSKLSLEDLFNFLSNIASYVISGEVTLKSGQTIGNTADQKIAITSSKGRFVEGESIKLHI
jgi:hypothetical protein